MRPTKRAFLSTIFLTLFTLFAHQQVVTARVVVDEPDTRRVGEILYQGANGQYYTVQSGDTLWSISAQFGVGIDALLTSNSQIVNPNYIYAGSALWIPGAAVATSTTTTTPTETTAAASVTGLGLCNFNHYVQLGDTLFGIAYYYSADLMAIMQWNNILDPDLIVAGSWLYIPCS